MKYRDRDQSRFSYWLLIALTVFGLAYLAAIPFGLLKHKFDTVDVAVFIALLIFNSGFLKRLGRLAIGSKGVELELQEVKTEQKRQRVEIDTLRFLITSYVTKKEMVHLTKLAKKEPFPYKKNSSFESELRRLRSLDFIRNLSDKTVGGMPKEGDLRDYFEITDKGIQYTQLRQDLITELDAAEQDDAPK
jgi:hypothetical protein